MKISIIGAGLVGSTAAQLIAYRDTADVVLLDIVEGRAQGRALDIMMSSPLRGFNCRVEGTNDYTLTGKSDIVVITAGVPRTAAGMSREMLYQTNMSIVEEAALQSVKQSPDCILIVVSNPVDALTFLAWRVTGLPRERVIGLSGALDSSRLRYFISDALKVKPENVSAMVIGSHNDLMVPVLSQAAVAGEPLSSLLSEESISSIAERTAHAGSELTRMLSSSAYFAAAAALADMVEAIALDKNQLISCSAVLDGEYGLSGVAVGVPVRLGRKGIEKIMILSLSSGEKKQLAAGAEQVLSLLTKK